MKYTILKDNFNFTLFSFYITEAFLCQKGEKTKTKTHNHHPHHNPLHFYSGFNDLNISDRKPRVAQVKRSVYQ